MYRKLVRRLAHDGDHFLAANRLNSLEQNILFDKEVDIKEVIQLVTFLNDDHTRSLVPNYQKIYDKIFFLIK